MSLYTFVKKQRASFKANLKGTSLTETWEAKVMAAFEAATSSAVLKMEEERQNKLVEEFETAIMTEEDV